MARAKAARRERPSGTPEDRLIAAALALALAARQGWRRTGLAEIAAEAGLKLHEAYAIHRSKGAILRAFIRRIDQEVLAGAAPDASESARERLFDTLMRRFEALKPHKEAVRAIARDSVGDPGALLGLAVMRRSMQWMLEASGISIPGCAGRAVTHLMLALHLSVLRTFLGDDSPDLAATMKALDQGLRRGESLCRFLPRRNPRSRAA
jgi:AcrR family transcriptional regulator